MASISTTTPKYIMTALEFNQAWVSVDDNSTYLTHHKLYEQAELICKAMGQWRDRPEDIEALGQFLASGYAKYSHLFASNILHEEIGCNWCFAALETLLSKNDTITGLLIEKIKEVEAYAEVPTSTESCMVRFYARCIDHVHGAEERDRYLSRIEHIDKAVPRNGRFSWVSDFNKRWFLLSDMTDHQFRYFKDHILAFRGQLKRRACSYDLIRMIKLLSSEYARFFHIFGRDILTETEIILQGGSLLSNGVTPEISATLCEEISKVLEQQEEGDDKRMEFYNNFIFTHVSEPVLTEFNKLWENVNTDFSKHEILYRLIKSIRRNLDPHSVRSMSEFLRSENAKYAHIFAHDILLSTRININQCSGGQIEARNQLNTLINEALKRKNDNTDDEKEEFFKMVMRRMLSE